MNNYTVTYWPPETATGIGIGVMADEFAFTETNVLFLIKNPTGPSTVVAAIPLGLLPLIRCIGPTT